MNIQPEQKVGQLIDRLSRLDEDADNTFPLKSIENEAKALLNTDAHDAYMVFGIIAADRGDIEQCKANFSKSIKLSDNSIVRSNFAYSLMRLRCVSSAYKQTLQAIEMSPDDIPSYRHAINIALIAGYPEKAIELNEILMKLNAETNDTIDFSISNSKKIISLNLTDGYIIML